MPPAATDAGPGHFIHSIGEPIGLELTGAPFPKQGARLTRSLSSAVPAGQGVVLGSWDSISGWRPVKTKLSKDRRQVTATIFHFSVWDEILYWDGKFLTKRAPAPQCQKNNPKWVASTVYVADKNNQILWCSGRSKEDPDLLVVKAVNNRSFGVAIEPAVKPLRVHSSLFGDSGVEDLLKAGLTAGLTLPDKLSSLNGLFFLPPGIEVELTFSEKQVRDVDPDTLVRARMDPQWIISGVMYDAIADVLKEGDGGFATLFALLGVVQCEQDLGHDLISRPQAVAASVSVISCAADNADIVVKSFVHLARGKIEDLSRKAALLKRALLVVSLGQLGGQIVELLSDGWIQSPYVRQFHAYAVAQSMGPFAGSWFVHGSTLLIAKTGRARVLTMLAAARSTDRRTAASSETCTISADPRAAKSLQGW